MMRYHALACDYDGTIAHHGTVDPATLRALERLTASGRVLLLVTGRILDDLKTVFPELGLFHAVIAENGAVLYRPATHEEIVLAEPPPEAFVEELRRRAVTPLAVGRVIVATWEPMQVAVMDAIREMGIELQVIFNKGAVMILPSGTNKASGLRQSLRKLQLSPHNTVGVGDAENDHAFLSLCECSVAVANAIPTLKERADLVTAGSQGEGVIELIEDLIATDLASVAPRLVRHELLLGHREDGTPVQLQPYGTTVLIAGTSGSGKSTFASSVLERLSEHEYQYCIIDPEGDYAEFDAAVVLGDSKRVPSVDEIVELLQKPNQNIVANLLGVSMEHRPALFDTLLMRLQELRAWSGHPHWIVVDETHHLMPPAWDPARMVRPQELHGMLLITVHPEHVAPPALASVDTVIALGEDPDGTIRTFSETLGEDPPQARAGAVGPGEAAIWQRKSGAPPFRFQTIPPKSERRRHVRKYAHGELGEDKSFYFRGPEQKLNLRAQNLMIFLQLAEGVDHETWMHHLREGDYSRWFREAIKDDVLAEEVQRIERDGGSAEETRAAIRRIIEERYTAAP